MFCSLALEERVRCDCCSHADGLEGGFGEGDAPRDFGAMVQRENAADAFIKVFISCEILGGIEVWVLPSVGASA